MVALALAGCVAPEPQLEVEPSAVAERLHQAVGNERLRQRQPEKVVEAIQTAGQYRVQAAIPDLISLLGFRYFYPWETEKQPAWPARRSGGRYLISPARRYPATEALAEIGAPALPALLEVIETQPFTSIASKNARFTVRLTLRGTTEANQLLKDSADKASTPEARQRLLEAVKTADEDWKLNREDLHP